MEVHAWAGWKLWRSIRIQRMVYAQTPCLIVLLLDNGVDGQFSGGTARVGFGIGLSTKYS